MYPTQKINQLQIKVLWVQKEPNVFSDISGRETMYPRQKNKSYAEQGTMGAKGTKSFYRRQWKMTISIGVLWVRKEPNLFHPMRIRNAIVFWRRHMSRIK
ncbi:hypothetical protein M8C21_033547 [Ambrosia artemisiifolia]|uniref:Uncharacterized protein n=1 Tax=Ambrosia artemisiifolia TaxID=4212 RepID=A0AAD5C8Q6_AMBAR|nr:hypothetical protein M8C21_033547 [Ambrosia artemisiifolia]